MTIYRINRFELLVRIILDAVSTSVQIINEYQNEHGRLHGKNITAIRQGQRSENDRETAKKSNRTADRPTIGPT